MRELNSYKIYIFENFKIRDFVKSLLGNWNFAARIIVLCKDVN